jgi:hypothetical protein
MGLGYPPRRNNEYDGPRVVPGRGYVGDKWRLLRAVLVILFLLFDVAGLVWLFFPGAITIAQSATVGPQTILFPTLSAKLPSVVAAAPSLTPAAQATAGVSGSVSATAGVSGSVSATANPSTTPSSATATGQPVEAAPGIYVESMRLDPPTPRRNQDLFFYVTFVNTTGAVQPVRWDVLVYRPDNSRQYFGQSLPVGKGESIAPGTHELRSFGPYRLSGGGGCEQVVVRIGRLEEGQPAVLFNQPDGNSFLQTITICP